MAHINGTPDSLAGYFHESGDAEKTATARRSDYKPGPLNRLTNKFARNDHPRLAKFANGIRSIDLSLRQAVNNRRLDSARKRFDAVDGADNATLAELQAAAAPVNRLAHKARRLDTKQLLGQVAAAGELADGVQEANEGLQHALLEDGFVPLEGLRDIAHTSIPSGYLVGPDGHRIKINMERAPLAARVVADSVSAGYDRGSSGAGRAIRSTWQHALVGVYSAEQSIKGMAARKLSGASWLDDGARARMDVRAARTVQKRTLLQAAFKGNAGLNNAYIAVVNEQQEGAQQRLDNSAGPEYAVRERVDGVKPAQTHFLERRAKAYYQARQETGTSSLDTRRTSSPDAIGRFLSRVPSLRRSTDGAGTASTGGRTPVRRSSVQGQLVDSVRTGSLRTRPETPRPHVEDDDDLYD